MEIVDAKSSILCNFEVLQFLKEEKTNIEAEQTKRDGKKEDKRKGNVAQATITYETLAWLENSPAGLQQEHHIKECYQKLNEAAEEGGFRLTDKEIVQLLNHRPATAVEIQLLIEDSEERLTDVQVEEIISIVQETLPGNDEEEVEEGEEEEEEDKADDNEEEAS